MKRVLVAALAAVMLCALQPARAEEDCRLHIAASLPLHFLKSGRVAIDAEVSGRPLLLLVDTGSPSSILTKGTADALGLEQRAVGLENNFSMYGGERLTRYTVVKDFKFGKMTAPRVAFLIMQDRSDGIDGLLGTDFLSQFDMDFDFAGAKLNLFQPHPCEGKAVYWTQNEDAIAKIGFDRQGHDPHILVPVSLDGKKITAILDTGASTSTMHFEAAEHFFDLKTDSPGVTVRTGNEGPLYFYPFKTLTFEGVTVNSPKIVLMPRGESKFSDVRALLGISILRQLHLFIAYRERMIYVTAADAKVGE
jgi:predicted aspartyl protease